MKKLVSVFIFLQAWGYDLPSVNLGFTNILDGGPVRPTHGFYLLPYVQYYESHKFRDGCGNLLGGVPSPKTENWNGIIELAYQSEIDVFWNAKGGIDTAIPFSFYSTIQPNSLGLLDSGRGFGDFYMGPYLQWNPVEPWNGGTFVHRFQFAASFPTGKYQKDLFNPGNGFYFIGPYWAGTLFFTPKFATSWRLNYLWSAKNKHTGIQAGQAIIYNYSIEYEVIKHVWLSTCGYYLKQYTDSKINNIKTPGRREQVFAIGPGALYAPNDDLYFFGYAYFEQLARNRTQGINIILRSVIHF